MPDRIEPSAVAISLGVLVVGGVSARSGTPSAT